MRTVMASVGVRPASAELASIADAAARHHDVPVREVLVRLLLHLPREADADARVPLSVAVQESERLAARLAARSGRYSSWQAPPSAGVPRVRDLVLRGVEEEIARIVLERFHYLGSFRHASEHYGASVASAAVNRPAAMFTVAPLDVPTIAARLPPGVAASDVAVLARVFAFDWAPANTLSFLMARLMRVLRGRSDPPRMIVTYLNPNVGFTGASYRAANWVAWARETGTRYSYLDGDYVTDRELQRRFGSADPDVLALDVGDRVTFSTMSMAPLELFAYPIDGHLREALEVREPVELARPRA